MKYIEILYSFEQQIGVIDDPLAKPKTDDSLFWLNLAIDKFVKLRFNGDPVHHLGFEQTEKRRTDLMNLFKTDTWTTTDMTHYLSKTEKTNYDSFSVNYPEDFLYATDESVVICDLNNKNEMDTCTFECTRDSFMYRINNSLTDFHYRFHRARPLRIRTSEGCELLTDKNYKIKKYTLGYIRKPNELTLDNPKEEYEDFSDSAMSEIIRMAAQMYLENTKNERYQSITQEVLTQE